MSGGRVAVDRGRVLFDGRLDDLVGARRLVGARLDVRRLVDGTRRCLRKRLGGKACSECLLLPVESLS